ncbi:MAG: hypothetical protein KGK30_00580 [Elusimicrobia bacterium]|nr:hypothetical protein [Elusimicrobiota bacterium]
MRLWTAVTIVPGWPPMVANAALMSILSGAALALLADPALRPGSKRAACAFSSACALAAALTLVEYALGIDLRIDQLLARAVATAAMRIPGRPMPHTALAFLLLGLALCLLDAGER